MKPSEDGTTVQVEAHELPVVKWALLHDALTRMSVGHLEDAKATVFTFSAMSYRAVRSAIADSLAMLEAEIIAGGGSLPVEGVSDGE